MQDRVCHLCGRPGPLSPVAQRCATCSALVTQASNTAASARRVPIRVAEAETAIAEAIERCRDLYPEEEAGYVCAFSEVLLEVDQSEFKRGDYASFDHSIPNRSERADLCSRIVNDLKGWMTDQEFRRFVCDVLDPTAPRRIHGIDEETSREFLIALRTVMRREGSSEKLRGLRGRLKQLSAVFRY